METKAFIGRKAELDGIRNGFSSGGSAKAFIFTGEHGIGKSALLSKSWQSSAESGQSEVRITPSLSGLGNAAEVATAFARGVDACPASLRQGLPAFARGFGQKIFELQREFEKSDGEDEKSFDELLAEVWVDQFLKALPSLKDDSAQAPSLIFAFDDLDQTKPIAVDWFTNFLLPTLDVAGLGEQIKYLFTGQSMPDGAGSRLIEATCRGKLIEMNLRPFRVSECSELAKSLGDSSPDGERLRTLSGGIPLRLTRILGDDSPIMAKEEEKTEEIPASTLTGFTPEQTVYIIRAAYLPEATKESLGLFTDPRNASLGFNWIKNAKGLAEVRPGNALVLNSDLRKKALALHQSVRPDESSEWRQLSEYHLNFTKTFPDPHEHWIPLRLSNFRRFDQKVLQRLFSERETQLIMDFLERYEDFFEENSGKFEIRHDVLGLIKRYKSIMHLDHGDEEFLSSIALAWEENKKDAELERLKLEGEREKISKEINGAAREIVKLNELKGKLLKAFLDPSRRKSRRTVNFKISLSLLLLGLTTVGLSLAFRDLFGPYHALAGIVVTIFGFFWPMTQWTTGAAIDGSQGMDRFAVETQQRMLKHRVAGLVTRTNFLQNSIRDIDQSIQKVDSSLLEPYLAEN